MRLTLFTLVRVVVLVSVVLVMVSAVQAADRDKLLSEPGVYGTFAAFSLDADWAKQDQVVRIAQLTVLKGVVEQHREKLAIDVYLLRGLSDHADLLFRIHATELRETQQFLLDLQGSLFGKHLKTAGLMHGLTKKANYVPGMPDQSEGRAEDSQRAGPQTLCDRDPDPEECRLVGAGSGETRGHDAGTYGSHVALSQDGQTEALSLQRTRRSGLHYLF